MVTRENAIAYVCELCVRPRVLSVMCVVRVTESAAAVLSSETTWECQLPGDKVMVTVQVWGQEEGRREQGMGKEGCLVVGTYLWDTGILAKFNGCTPEIGLLCAARSVGAQEQTMI